MNLCDDLFRRCGEAPDQLAFAFEDGTELSYSELDRHCAEASARLIAAGLKGGDRLALHLQNSPELLILLFAAWRVGVVPVNLNIMYKFEEIAHAIRLSEPQVFYSSNDEVTAFVRESFPEVGIWSGNNPSEVQTGLPQAGRHPPPLDLPPESEAAILFTGGSTGAPKAVSVTHGGFANSVAVQASASKGGKTGPFPVARKDTPPNIVAVPLFHMLGQKQVLFAFHVGRSVLLLERFRPDVFIREARKYNVDNFVLLPTMVFDMVNHMGPLDLGGVKHILVGGQQLSSEVRRQFELRFKIPILSIYGSTETGSIAGWTASDVRDGKWKSGSVGRIFPGVELRIVDDGGRDCAVGETGEIWVRANIAKGYLDEGSDSLLKPGGWVATGDMGYIDSDRVLFLNGRRREIIKCGGYQVFPAEIEEELRHHAWVRDVAVVGVPDERLGEVPKAFVVLNSTAPFDFKELAEGLISYSRERLANFKSIRHVEVISALPRNEVGKVERHRLTQNADVVESSS